MSGEQSRLALFAGAALLVVVGVGLSFGLGPALIVAGLVGMAVAVAWAYVVVTSA